jgi:hypothetical protein
MRKVQAQGIYVRKATGEEVSFDFEYPVYDSIEDIKNTLGDKEGTADINRMAKVDARNTASAKAKSANGDSTAKVLTPEQKEANKVERKGLANLKAKAKAKGMSIEDLMELIG